MRIATTMRRDVLIRRLSPDRDDRLGILLDVDLGGMELLVEVGKDDEEIVVSSHR